MNYKSLEIANFRSIHSLKADNFSRVNLFTGKNNSGKTTFLEAVFLVSGMSNPNLPVVINNFRGLEVPEDASFNTIFYNLDFAQTPEIKAGVNNHFRTLSITPVYSDPSKPDFSRDAFNTSAEPLMQGIKLDFSDDNKNYSATLSIKENKIDSPQDYQEELYCAYYNTKLSSVQLYKKVEKLVINKKLDDTVSVLKQIDERICDIRMGVSNSLFIDVGHKELMPLNTMGDGIIRILSIIASIYDCENGILLIDEIENGFHYRTLETLWRAVLNYAKEYNVQLFITTHSWECVSAMSDNMKKLDYRDIMLYRLDKKGEQHKAVIYEPELIAAGIEGNYEFR